MAFLEGADDTRRWLLGDGSELTIDPDFHGPGEHRLVVLVRDRAGNIGQAEASVTIR